MSDAGALRVVSLSGRDAAECITEAKIAQDHGADWAEVRLDRWTAKDREKIASLFPSPLPLLATFRSREEGGEGSDASDLRADELARIARQPFGAVDVELRRDVCTVPNLVVGHQAGAAPVWVYSAHLPAEATTAELARLIGEPLPTPGLRKLVLPCSVSRAVLELLPWFETLGAPRPVLHSTGPSGPLFRAWADRLGMPLVFASLPADRTRTPVEPSQLPIDRLRRQPMGEPPQPLVALLGDPVLQSPSPELFASFWHSEHPPGLYLNLELPSARTMGSVCRALADRGFVGVSVTRPLKFEAITLAAAIGSEAARAGCANLLVFGGDGWRAENTDVRAIRRRWRELEDATVPRREPVVVFGAGGAARATATAAALDGRPVSVLARDTSEFVRWAHASAITIVKPPERPAAWVVNSTTVGRPGAGELPESWLDCVGSGTRLLDWVYAPAIPHLEERAIGRGAVYEDGRRLLLYQASEAFR
ncbi:MAG: type I 3-dehydroquinate dehydratase, partial [Thermoplasmata archaeon]|nr:type I 3-dehydroquinate dehydratase [Thermoplasmata archaeon]